MVEFRQKIITPLAGADPTVILGGNSKRVCVILTTNSNLFWEVFTNPSGTIAFQFVDTQSVSHLIMPYRDYGPLIQSELALMSSAIQLINVTEIIDSRFNADYGLTWR